jgi:serine/threonine protein phosphatase PrpC
MAEPPRDPRGDPEISMRHEPVDNDAARLAVRAALSPILGADAYRSPSSAVRVEFGARSHRGASRTTNEDHYLVVRVGRHQETLATSLSGSDVPPRYEESGYAMLVADGLGESGSGSVASRVALSTFAHLALHDGKWNVRIDSATVAEIFARTARRAASLSTGS